MRVLVSTMLVESAESPRHLLVSLGVYHLSVVDSTSLHLFVESVTVETHIRTCRSFNRAIIEMISGDGATPPSYSVA